MIMIMIVSSIIGGGGGRRRRSITFFFQIKKIIMFSIAWNIFDRDSRLDEEFER